MSHSLFSPTPARLAGALAWLAASLFLAPPAFAQVSDPDYVALEQSVSALYKAGRYSEAKARARQLVAWAEASYADQPRVLALAYLRLGRACQYLREYAEAERNFELAVMAFDKHYGRNVAHAETATVLGRLGSVYVERERYDAAVSAYKRSLEMYKVLSGPRSGEVADALFDLGETVRARRDFLEAEPLIRQAIEISQERLGPEHPFIGKCLRELGIIASETGRLEEAERHYQRSIAILMKAGPSVAGLVALNYSGLAWMFEKQGRYAEADAYYRQALKIHEGAERRVPAEAITLHRLAVLMSRQGRDTEAEAFYLRALALRERLHGPDHPSVATTLHDLGMLRNSLQRPQEAETLLRRALDIYRKTYGDESVYVGIAMLNLGVLCREQKRFAEAEEWMAKSIAIHEPMFESRPLPLGDALRNRARLYYVLERYTDADTAIRRAIGIFEQQASRPSLRVECYALQARIAWKQNRRAAAVADLHKALGLVEEARLQASGAEQERAQFFSQFSAEFETMLAWQFELGDMEQVLKTIERQRARTLLDEMNRGRVDMQAGRSPEEKKRLRDQELELKGRMASLERQIEVALGATPRNDAELQRLGGLLGDTRRRMYELYRDERSTNPIYRQITKETSSPTIQEFRDKLVGKAGLALVYQLGDQGGYVMVIGPQEARLVPLALDETAAQTLGTTPGPLTLQRAKEIMVGKEKAGPGVVKQLAQHPKQVSPEDRTSLTKRLAALWQVLVPQAERAALTAGGLEQLVIVPDGPLALLPFEALVIEPGANPEYLLDRGPPILYGPSASVLYNLTRRPVAEESKSYYLATVGDPAYGGVGQAMPAGGDPLVALTNRGRYAGIGGSFARLPYTAVESKAVAAAYTQAGKQAAILQQQYATEAYVRHYAPGRKILHLACHGVTDQAYGNFFGALALTPGPKAASDPSDDGFLTMPEIYELKLAGCELAILSACETNFGPQQQGEGTWALSRGFLIAGARRVVASNWLVDDEAASSLIGRYCSLVASSKKPAEEIDHAAQLQAAKRFIRDQEQWRSPYYWSTFVLIGPR